MKLLCLELVSEFGKYDNLDRGDVVTHARMRSKTDKQAGPAEKQFVNAASQRLENSPRAFHCWLPGSHAVVGHEPRHKKRKGLPSLDRSSIGRAISLVSGFRRFLLPIYRRQMEIHPWINVFKFPLLDFSGRLGAEKQRSSPSSG